MKICPRLRAWGNHGASSGAVLSIALGLVLATVTAQAQTHPCANTVRARVVALDQAFWWNRLGAYQPQGMMFALERDVVSTVAGADPAPGAVQLRPDKRPRPLVLRVNAGDCLEIEFTNLLADSPVDGEQPATRKASIHVAGMQVVGDISGDGSNVGQNPESGLVPPGGSKTYTLFAEREGIYHLFSAGATTGGQGDGGSLSAGLFGAVNVEPAGSVWYRSQVTAADLAAATTGTVGQGQPIIDYDAVYPSGATYPSGGEIPPGTPVLKILQGDEIVHSDLTAIIHPTRPDTYIANPLYPGRNLPFREFTIIYHDELGAVQAFDLFRQDGFQHTLHGVQDAFAFNYGTGGIGAEIIANRLGVGPMKDCVECKYEEFFLTSWVVSDPAMVVDVPANASDPAAGVVATAARYPDDPSNVYHSYLKDHAKMRILHAGPKEHHIHHLHAHQWGKSPDSDDTSYVDSQALGPGAGFTLEMVWNGSGNRNQAVGDSIFHCHFYPHFAMGMWALWRVHDVLETGTVLERDPVDPTVFRPAAGSRALPDGEIAAGTPIPAVVPVPGLPMAPLPGIDAEIVDGQVQIQGKPVHELTEDDLTLKDAGGQPVLGPDGKPVLRNPGYPFFVPGIAGHRPPHPPLDFATDDNGQPIDGGLPRHVVVTDPGNHAVSVETLFDFTKEIESMKALQLPEDGIPVEKAAMAFHAVRHHDTFRPDGTPALGTYGFLTNGNPPVSGAPYAEPCIDDYGNPIGRDSSGDPKRRYKAAVIQTDAILNKQGWHFPQMRLITLWEDVQPTYDGIRAPEPFFFRANSRDCIEFWHTNLVPNVYELDDYQVRTPTDILGQHIHLVKFDVTSSDGSANGYNYEDGTFSPDEVVERIEALNSFTEPDGAGGTISGGFIATDGTRPTLEARAHPFFGAGPPSPQNPAGGFLGAQTTVQRWLADTVENIQGNDRTLRTIFTHDHYGPSTHQQVGLYAGLLIEPTGSRWLDSDTGVAMGTRSDGGPTSWRANIETATPADSYREFMLELADFQHAYLKGSIPGITEGKGPTFPNAWAGAPLGQQPGQGQGFGVAGVGVDNRPASVNPPAKVEVPLDDPRGPILLAKAQQLVFENGGVHQGPIFPEAISADDPGSMVVNYRNEPIAARIAGFDATTGQPRTNPVTGEILQAAGLPGDLAHVYRSDVTRENPALNTPPTAWPYNTAGLIQTPDQGKLDGDPFTPMLRAYENDRIQLRILVGGQEEGHNFEVHGAKWLGEPDWENSGYRASQVMGISEHFELLAPARLVSDGRPFIDYLYKPGAAVDDQWNGLWGLLRIYADPSKATPKLVPLGSNPKGSAPRNINPKDFAGPCPRSAPKKTYSIAAVRASQVLGPNGLVYNSRTAPGGPLKDPTAIIFFHKADLAFSKTGALTGLKKGVPVEPLVLRAAAGDCIHVTVENLMPAGQPAPDLSGFNTLPMIVEHFNANEIQPSAEVGLHAQLVNYDAGESEGTNVGRNLVQVGTAVPPRQTAAPGTSAVTYKWYAGEVSIRPDGTRVGVPIEFGAINLTPADPIKHSNKGAVAALIIEPKGSAWTTDPSSRAAATVFDDPNLNRVRDAGEAELFREFVTVFQNDVNLRFGSDASGLSLAKAGSSYDAGAAVPSTADAEDPEDSAQKAVNYRTEPLWFRKGFAPDAPLSLTRALDFSNVIHNSQVGGDPKTPVFTAKKGQQVRFRVLEPAGHARNHVFTVFGHVWQEMPYTLGSTRLGENREFQDAAAVPATWGRWKSPFEGARMGHGPTNHFDVLLQNGAGGKSGVTGDYLWRDMASFYFDGGIWGLLRVTP